MSKQDSWESQHKTTAPFWSETWVPLSNKKLSTETTFRHKMVCGYVGFGYISGGEEAGNATKLRAVYGQFQLLGQIKIVQYWKRKVRSTFVFWHILKKKTQPKQWYWLLQGKETKKCNTASVYPVLLFICLWGRGENAQTCILFFLTNKYNAF